MRFVYSLFLLSLMTGVGLAAPQMLRGELTGRSLHDLGQYSVELQPIAGNTMFTEQAFVSHDGRFEFRDISTGQYVVIIRDGTGAVVHRDFADTHALGLVSIRLPDQMPARPVSGTVSLHELSHKPPKRARKAYEQAMRKANSGDLGAALTLLETAVAIDPEYLQAINNLGVQYLRAGRYEEAGLRFRQAIALSPRTPMLHANLAQALLSMRDFKGAEVSAREAIALDATDPLRSRAQLALGVALANEGETVKARTVLEQCSESPEEAVRRAARAYLLKWE